MKPDSMVFDSIVIIESLREEDRKTGTSLHRNLAPLASSRGVSLAHHTVQTAEELIRVVEQVTRDVASKSSRPVLHIEVHGSEDAIRLASGEVLAWEDLRSSLTALNVATRLNLLVVLAACSGAHLARVIHPTQRAPVWAVIGPTIKVFDGDLERQVLQFYRAFLKSLDGRVALEALNDAAQLGEWKYTIMSAQYLFRQAFGRYVSKYCTPDTSARRAKEIAERARGGLTTSPELDLAVEGVIASRIQDPSWQLEKFKRHFFMYDLFPENKNRFSFSTDDCASLGE